MKIWLRNLRYRLELFKLVRTRRHVMKCGNSHAEVLMLAVRFRDKDFIKEATRGLKEVGEMCTVLDVAITTHRIAIRSGLPIEDARFISAENIARRLSYNAH